jgi:hypothetical protein
VPDTEVPVANPHTQGSIHTRLGVEVGASPTSTPGPSVFPAPLRWATSPSVPLVRSPLTFQDDLSAIKDFPIHESVSLQFRLEAFNVLNKVQFGFPNTTVGSSTFGYITSQANLPRNVQAALKLYS